LVSPLEEVARSEAEARGLAEARNRQIATIEEQMAALLVAAAPGAIGLDARPGADRLDQQLAAPGGLVREPEVAAAIGVVEALEAVPLARVGDAQTVARGERAAGPLAAVGRDRDLAQGVPVAGALGADLDARRSSTERPSVVSRPAAGSRVRRSRTPLMRSPSAAGKAPVVNVAPARVWAGTIESALS